MGKGSAARRVVRATPSQNKVPRAAARAFSVTMSTLPMAAHSRCDEVRRKEADALPQRAEASEALARASESAVALQ
eukprot:6213967-Pleurochrysis_carterae.AAC.2